ncbi:MAG: bifunctional (p)ppGpp synthetase/guanosine-3',5'-bis(diphosphate) 3'-pyrophosphohydrolase [Proteobacteria bacterium]|nr:bifunctional (p)ppGpp synthetase/guanosine-3',5'-bis(diphosphate) 3'-pyrophosphohydrolase [Pseudomonadota bacterium]
MSKTPIIPLVSSKPKELADLISCVKQYNPEADTSLIEKAYLFSEEVHKGQKRSSGESYFHHPIEVAFIIAELRLDTVTVATALLHDTVEDTVATLPQIEEQFGPEIAALVDGVTKISQISFQTSEEKQAENFRKMVFAMAKDLRVILVKLADRTHNMRTLQHLRPDKQARIAQETLDIYAPLANRLGLSAMKRELEDLSLRYSKPEIYYKLVSQVSKKLKERDQYTNDVLAMIEGALQEHGYHNSNVTGRPKHFYSIHKKMEKRNLTFEQVYDLTGFRIVLGTVEQCYGALGLIHSLWTPVPGRFKDYIAIPKANFYQSLHTTVVGPGGEKIEIQIRTQQMHETAERGIAAHWAYKEGKNISAETSKFSWLNRLVEWNKDLQDPNEFLETVKLDLFSEDVYIFTPKGKVIEFPQGATPLDFAYTIHTDLGHHCIGAKVNGRMVSLKYKLKSGDTVEVLTSPNQTPHKDWLKLVKTSRAKSKIRQFIKVQEHERSMATGEMLLEKELKKEDLKLKSLIKEGIIQKGVEAFSLKSVDDLLSAIGYGKLSPKKVMSRLPLPSKEKEVAEAKETKELKETKRPLQKIVEEASKKSTTRQVVKVKGIEDLLVHFARCCSPVPGDSVVGFITRGRGISVHTRKCPKIFDSDPHRLIDIEWDTTTATERAVKIRVICEDRPGLLADMSGVIKDQDANITRAQIGTTKDKKALCLFSISIKNLNHLSKIISAIEGISGVLRAERVQKKDR